MMLRRLQKDNNGQMLMIEAVLFAAMVLIAISFVSQLAPPAVVSHRYTNNLKVWGDGSLLRMYNTGINDTLPYNYPNNMLSYFLINNSYDYFIDNFSKDPRISHSAVMYNVYISNGTKTIFWCSSNGDIAKPLTSIGIVSRSHRIISIDPVLLNSSASSRWFSTNNPLYNSFVQEGYNESTYDILVELWYYV